MKSLKEKFEKKPYGWYYASILCLLAKICVRGKVELKIDGNILDEDDQEKALRNTHGHGNLVLEPQEEFTASQIRALKKFYEDFFDTPPSSKEAKALGKETEEAFRNLLKDLYPLTGQISQYTFLTNLSAAVEELKEAEGKPYTWFLKELVRKDDHLMDLKEGIIDPIRKFMAGPQKEIYDSARELLINQKPNLEYGFTESAKNIAAVLRDTECYKGNKIQQLKINVEELKAGVKEKLQTEIAKAVHMLQALQIRLSAMDEFQQLPEDRRSQLIESFTSFQDSLKAKELIAGIRDSLRRFEDDEYPRLLSTLSRPEESAGSPSFSSEDNSGTPDAKQTQSQVISRRSILVDYNKAWLADEGDVDSYLDALRKALLAEIKNGKRIQI